MARRAFVIQCAPRRSECLTVLLGLFVSRAICPPRAPRVAGGCGAALATVGANAFLELPWPTSV